MERTGRPSSADEAYARLAAVAEGDDMSALVEAMQDLRDLVIAEQIAKRGERVRRDARIIASAYSFPKMRPSELHATLMTLIQDHGDGDFVRHGTAIIAAWASTSPDMASVTVSYDVLTREITVDARTMASAD